MKGYIYLYTHRKSESETKYYVGQTIHLVRRKHEHKMSRSDSYFDRAIKKYGYNSFEFSILEEIDLPTKEEVKIKLDELEIYYINKYDSISNGYNIKPGGSSSKSEFETSAILKMSEAAKKQWSNLEFRKERSDEMKNLWKDKDYRESVSLGLKKAWENEEYRNNVSNKRKEMWKNPEFREKMKNIKKSPKRGILVSFTDLISGKQEMFKSISKLIRDKGLSSKVVRKHLTRDGIYLTKTYKIELVQ